MLAQRLIGSALFSGSLAAGLAPTRSTSDATITPGPQLELLRKQNDNRYIGWVSWNGLWSSEQCDVGGTYYQTSDFWRCCATTANGCARGDIPIGCISGSLIYPATGSSLSSSLVTWPCTSIFTELTDRSFTICNTVFMYENERDSDPLTNVNCGVSSLNWSYYRVQPSPTTTPVTRSPSPSVRSTPAVSSPTTTPNPVPTPIPQPEEKKESKAWIAGAVVGPIVGLALIGFGAFFFVRRKKSKQAKPQPAVGGAPPAAPASYPQQTYPPGPNSPPQYYPPMQQNNAAPGLVPFGVAKHDSWAGPQSPMTQGSMSPTPQSPYGAPPQQGWQGQNNMQINQAPPVGGQPVYNVPSPSMSPQPGHVLPAQHGADSGMYKHTSETVRPFSSELEGSYAAHGQPEYVNVQPKQT
ncbi:hypothetical protein BKA66DRAFT_230658 [Pyrenochaeta sp. MPI-SDFR-AT-0127]|nr:hypothetical protein BKA66DRAFT_230658 [Pyrenochaeta sp. MPI-SDFR-AT-0127]